MGLNKKQTFTRKPYNSRLYKWSPQSSDKRVKKPKGDNNGKFYCNATAGSQGEDWITTYVYELTVDGNGFQHRYAYVACDYVQ